MFLYDDEVGQAEAWITSRLDELRFNLSANNDATQWNVKKTNLKVKLWFKMERCWKGWNNTEEQRGRKNGKQQQRLWEMLQPATIFLLSWWNCIISH